MAHIRQSMPVSGPGYEYEIYVMWRSWLWLCKFHIHNLPGSQVIVLDQPQRALRGSRGWLWLGIYRTGAGGRAASSSTASTTTVQGPASCSPPSSALDMRTNNHISLQNASSLEGPCVEVVALVVTGRGGGCERGQGVWLRAWVRGVLLSVVTQPFKTACS